MDYATFAESTSHSRRTIRHLVNLARNRVDSSPAFTLFLGAGASITSGVRGAQSLMEEWRRLRYASSNSPRSYEEWLSAQDWFESEDEYSQLFELTYDQPSQRRAFIENIVKKARPSWGYAYLASLIEERIFNTVFTTNFDDLINEACFQFGYRLRPLVCAHDSAVNSIRLMSERPKVVKLHGDFLYDSIKNTSSELSSLETNMRDKFMEFAREFGMIAVGYSGSDKSVMDALSVLARSPNCFRNGVYWCIRKGTAPGPRLRQFLRCDRVYWVEVDGFDEFMAELADGLGLVLPHGVTSPQSVALRAALHLFGEQAASDHPIISEARADLGELHTRVRTVLEDAGVLDPSSVRSGEPTIVDVTQDLESLVLPSLQAQAARHAKDYTRAESLIRQNLLQVSKDQRPAVLFDLLDCLLDSGSRAEEILNLLTSNADNYNEADDLGRLAYYALFINRPELALDFTDKALEINPGSVLALINQGVAHLQMGDITRVETVATTLVQPRMQARYRAAGHALRGDLDSLIPLLQQAIANNDYDAGAALSDVLFRLYWPVPRFLSALRPFHNKPLVATRAPHYPCCANELELQTRILASEKVRESAEGTDRTEPINTPSLN